MSQSLVATPLWLQRAGTAETQPRRCHSPLGTALCTTARRIAASTQVSIAHCQHQQTRGEQQPGGGGPWGALRSTRAQPSADVMRHTHSERAALSDPRCVRDEQSYSSVPSVRAMRQMCGRQVNEMQINGKCQFGGCGWYQNEIVIRVRAF